MLTEEVIALDDYEEGKWVTHRYSFGSAAYIAEHFLRKLPREVSVNIIQRLMTFLGGPAHLESPADREQGRLNLSVK